MPQLRPGAVKWIKIFFKSEELQDVDGRAVNQVWALLCAGPCVTSEFHATKPALSCSTENPWLYIFLLKKYISRKFINVVQSNTPVDSFLISLSTILGGTKQSSSSQLELRSPLLPNPPHCHHRAALTSRTGIHSPCWPQQPQKSVSVTELVLSGHHAPYTKDFRLLSHSHLTGAQFAGEETKVKGHSGWEPAHS